MDRRSPEIKNCKLIRLFSKKIKFSSICPKLAKIFDRWLFHPVNSGEILELGYGGGFPVAKKILEANKNYTGLDPSHQR